MSTAESMPNVSVADYLDGECDAATRHEYVDGRIYAMVGARNAHNRVASRVQGSLFQQLSGQVCEAFNSDTKIRIQHKQSTWFYYPDVSVVCEPNADEDVFQDKPVVIVKVLSDSTRRIDEGEKRDTYFLIESLSDYVLLEQDRPAAVVYTRNSDGQFVAQQYSGTDAVVPLPGIGAEIRLSEIYDRGSESSAG